MKEFRYITPDALSKTCLCNEWCKEGDHDEITRMLIFVEDRREERKSLTTKDFRGLAEIITGNTEKPLNVKDVMERLIFVSRTEVQ